mgnify:CR=1 FL=1
MTNNILALKYLIARSMLARIMPLLIGGSLYLGTPSHSILFFIGGLMMTGFFFDIGRRLRKTLPPLPDEEHQNDS